MISSKETEIIKNESNSKSGDEKCNNWNEKLPRGAWQKILQTGKKGKKISELEDGLMETISKNKERRLK